MASIESTGFSFYRADELRKISVCEISNSVSFDELNQPVTNGLFDPRLGAWDRNQRCPTCGDTDRNCPGHTGHIELPVPVYQPLLFGHIHKLLGLKCYHCHKLRLDELRVNYHHARLALLEAGEWAAAEKLREPPKPGAKKRGMMIDDDDEEDSEERAVAAKAIAAALSSVAGTDGNIGAHSRVERQIETKAFWKALKEPSRCENCGAARRKVRKDGATKLFQVPLDGKSQRSDSSRGISAPKSARAKKQKKRDEDEESSSSSSEEEEEQEDDVTTVTVLGKEKFMDPAEVREQLKLLWEQHSAAMDALLGQVGAVENPTGCEVFTISVLGVPAPRFRPAQTVGSILAEHPQNSSLSKVLQCSDKIRSLGDESIPLYVPKNGVGLDRRELLLKHWLELQNEVNIYMDSSKSSTPNQPPGIKQLLEKKEGMFRSHMMGKRVDYCCRSVISPDPFLGSGEVGMPLKFAKGLSYPEAVTPHNVEQLRAMVERGSEEWPGANYVELKGSRGTRVDLSRVTSRARRSALAKQLLTTPGQRVGRHVLDGDMVLLNRQPTLHKPGIMAHFVKVLSAEGLEDHQTFRMHYANCNAYNADFDGDEINCHLPQSELARAEAQFIVSTHEQYIVPTDGQPLRGLIQDHVDATVKLSMADCFFEREEYFQLVYDACRVVVGEGGSVDPTAGGEPALLKPRRLYTGRQLLSCVTAHVTRRFARIARRGPLLASFKGKSKVAAKAIGGESSGLDEQILEIRNGMILKGVFDKAQFGSNGLVHSVFELYGSSAAGCLLDTYARLLTVFIRDIAGHTCGIADMILTKAAETERAQLLAESYETGIVAVDEFLEKRFAIEDEVKRTAGILSSKESIVDRRKRRIANTIRSEGGGALLDGHMSNAMAPAHSKIVKACLPDGLRTKFPLNNFSLMVTTGAKGSVVNQSQISCALGQQSLEGRRVPLTGSGKSLPCFAPWDPSPRAGGFITDRFLTGIRPQEYYFHCMAGREGLVDTAVKTSRSGYLQRCLVKHLEELLVAYDLTVRDAQGSVVQFLYGEDGLDPTKASMLNGKKSLDFLAGNVDEAILDDRERAHPDILAAWEDRHSLEDEDSKEITEGAWVEARRCYKKKESGERKPARPKKRKQLSTRWSAARVLKVREDGTVDLEFAAEGAVVTRYPVIVEEIQAVRLPESQDSFNSRYRPTRFGAVSDKLARELKDAPTQLRDFVFAKYARSLAAPGEAVGCLAAQSVGEPSTQMTLNTFHLAGHGAGNVTLGIPRLREIIMTAATNIKTPLIVLPLRSPAEKQEAENLVSSLSRVTLMDLIDTRVQTVATERLMIRKDGKMRRVYTAALTLHSDAKIEAAFGKEVLEDDARACGGLELGLRKGLKKLIELSSKNKLAAALFQPQRPPPKAAEEASSSSSKKVGLDDSDDDESDKDDADEAEQGTLSFGRRKEVSGYDADEPAADDDVAAGSSAESESDDGSLDDMTKRQTKTPTKKKKEQQKAPAVSAASSSSGGPTQVRVTSEPGTLRKELKIFAEVPASYSRANFGELLETAASATVMRSAKSVTRAVVDPKRLVEGEERGAVLVEGRDFEAVWSATLVYDGAVAVEELESNDIAGFLRHYGVEAARASIVREIINVFGVYGITVDPRHLSLIADSMTQCGGYRAMNRNSMGLTSSPYLQMSFETTATFLCNAALANAEDDLKTPSASIVMGKVAKAGTGLFDLLAPLTPHRASSS